MWSEGKRRAELTRGGAQCGVCGTFVPRVGMQKSTAFLGPENSSRRFPFAVAMQQQDFCSYIGTALLDLRTI